MPPEGEDPLVARAFAELDTAARGPRGEGVRARCARFGIACRGMVLTLAERRPPPAPAPARLSPGLADALGRVKRSASPTALVSRASSSTERRAGRDLLESALALRPFEARAHLEAGLGRELDGDALGAAVAYETVLAGPWTDDVASARAAARDRYLRLLGRTPGAAARARRQALGAGRARVFALHWSSPRLDLDLWVLEPDGARCEPGRSPTPLGGQSPWDVVDARGPELYHPPARPGRYDPLVRSADGAFAPGAVPVGALFVVDGAASSPRVRARWIPGPGLVASLGAEDLGEAPESLDLRGSARPPLASVSGSDECSRPCPRRSRREPAPEGRDRHRGRPRAVPSWPQPGSAVGVGQRSSSSSPIASKGFSACVSASPPTWRRSQPASARS